MIQAISLSLGVFEDRERETPACIISSVLQDFYFPGNAGLPAHPLIADLEAKNKIQVFLFNPPNQLFHPRAHHNLHAGLLHGNYLVRSSKQIAMEKKSLAETIFTHSLIVR